MKTYPKYCSGYKNEKCYLTLMLTASINSFLTQKDLLTVVKSTSTNVIKRGQYSKHLRLFSDAKLNFSEYEN